MPDVRNCRRCGRIYNYLGGQPICPVCREADEQDFRRVKNYLYQYPGASISQVSKELDISVEKIKSYLKDGRLEIIGENTGNLMLECENCGKSIKSGRFCDACSQELSKELRSTADKINSNISKTKTQQKGIGMRYLNKDDKNKHR